MAAQAVELAGVSAAAQTISSKCAVAWNLQRKAFQLVPRFIEAAHHQSILDELPPDGQPPDSIANAAALSSSAWRPPGATDNIRLELLAYLQKHGFKGSLSVASEQPFLLELQAALLALAQDPAAWLPAQVASGGHLGVGTPVAFSALSWSSPYWRLISPLHTESLTALREQCAHELGAGTHQGRRS